MEVVVLRALEEGEAEAEQALCVRKLSIKTCQRRQKKTYDHRELEEVVVEAAEAELSKSKDQRRSRRTLRRTHLLLLAQVEGVVAEEEEQPQRAELCRSDRVSGGKEPQAKNTDHLEREAGAEAAARLT